MNKFKRFFSDLLLMCGLAFRLVRFIARTIVVALLVKLGLRAKRVWVGDLKFPVVVIPAGGGEPFVEVKSGDMTRVPRRSARRPMDGTIVIDSDFAMYTQESVRCTENDFGRIFRYLIPDAISLPYKFDLKARRETGREAAIVELVRCASYPGNSSDVDRTRTAIAEQSSMAGIVALLGGTAAESVT